MLTHTGWLKWNLPLKKFVKINELVCSTEESFDTFSFFNIFIYASHLFKEINDIINISSDGFWLIVLSSIYSRLYKRKQNQNLSVFIAIWRLLDLTNKFTFHAISILKSQLAPYNRRAFQLLKAFKASGISRMVLVGSTFNRQ